jgi:SAM-dependent methyltransferase/LmbE family N-acetylglucosaminyl deacetylase
MRKIDFLSEKAPHIFFSPHADDVVLSCGGTIHSLVSRNEPVEVIGVFAGVPENPGYSAYARHLHAKWHLSANPIEERWREDSVAMNELGISSFERWDYCEAPYRNASDGYPLYAVNEEIVGGLAAEDRKLRDLIAQKIRTHLDELPKTAVLYFPLSLGRHVDHQILFDIGLQFCALGRQVRFYEDYPYAEAYKINGQQKWQPEIVPIALEPKIRAACAYASQLRGLGGSRAALEKRLAVYGATVGAGDVSERYWEIPANAAQELVEQRANATGPLVQKGESEEPRFRDFGKFLKTFKWHDLGEVLPVGKGHCLDVGCGTGRHRALIETRGYSWHGVDRRNMVAATIHADASMLPLPEESVAAVVAWQILEYVDQPELVFAEASRVLEPGGVFCGSVSFLEPVHGRTYFNLSPHILERLLRRNGFADVEIKPGLNGFALTLWTWLGSTGIPSAESLAIALSLVLLGPLAGIIFFVSWLRWRVRVGSSHTMRWLTQTAPLDFAGHLMFVARKKARA